MHTSKPRSGTGTKAHNDADLRGGQAKAGSVHKLVRPRRTAGLIGLSVLASALALGGLSLSACGRATQPVESYGEARIGGPFKMIDQNGRAVDERVLLGKWSAVFFGYTYCPDTCPATLSALAATQARLTQAHLGPAAKTFQVVFVSVDPARDTPAQMKLYLSAQGLPGGAVGLTGSPAQVADIAKAYAAIYAKVGDGPDYQVQHSAAIYLMDPHGKFVRPLNEAQGPDAMAKQIAEAMQHD